MSSSAVQGHVCYVQCNFCNTILVVSVPGSNLSTILTVRCGHCGFLLSVNMGVLPQSIPPQELQKLQGQSSETHVIRWNCESPPIHTQEKKQRVPSAYNRFIKEEIRRLKATNPEISHREAFSAAAKNKGPRTIFIGKHNIETGLYIWDKDPTTITSKFHPAQAVG